MYNRNSILSEQYNFTVEQIFTEGESDFSVLRRSVAAGDPAFDVISMFTVHAAAAAREGLLVDLFNVQYLDFEKTWWDRDAAAMIFHINNFQD